MKKLLSTCAVLATFVACESKESSSSPTDSGLVPRAIFEGRIGSGATADCAATEDAGSPAGGVTSIGTFNPPQSVPDGALSIGTRYIACTVKPTADGKLDVVGYIGGTAGFVFSVKGQFASNGPSANVEATFAEQFTDIGCTVRYANPSQGIAPGRVWAKIKCPRIADFRGRACQAVAQFRFENCVQQ